MKKRFITLTTAILLLSGQCLPLEAADLDSTYIITLKDEYAGSLYDTAALLETKLPSCDVGYVYDTLLYGFELTMPESLVGYIESLDFVDSICPSGTFSALDTDSVEYVNGYSAAVESARELVGIDDSAAQLTGDGVVVAVIDSNFDVAHPAFSGKVTTETYTETTLASLLESERLNVSNLATADELYHNERIPFAFDYSGRDTDLSGIASHGTHVAGIIGANSTDDNTMQGIAPECQLLLMKVFTDDGEAADDTAIIAALEDAVKLGADVINLSLGNYSGSDTAKTSQLMENVLKKAEEAGCIVVSASGNDASSAERSRYSYEYDINQTPASYTDYGTAGYPSVSEHTLAVGSVDNSYSYGTAFGFDKGSELFSYSDTNLTFGLLDKTFAEKFANRSIEFVVVPGIGLDSDYDGLNVKGKLALISRGEITFAEKTQIAAAHGAIGVIFYNNVENEALNLDLTDAALPAIAITLEDGERLIEDERRELRFYPSASFYNENGGNLSPFSSVGPTPQLTLKPEICAVGGSVYSTIPDGYGTMSGTSMATPQIAGIMALLCENYPDIPKPDRPSTLRRVLMNTAKPLLQSDRTEYSPRFQGAGLVDLGAALTRELDIVYSHNNKPKVELFDLIGDCAYIDITLTNLTDSPLELALSASLNNDNFEAVDIDGEELLFSTMTSTPDHESTIISGDSGNLNRAADDFAPYMLTLDAGESQVVSLTIEFDEGYSEYLESVFTNGYYVEGYIYCESENGSYSIPYMGYSGDWTAAPILDSSVYDATGNQPVFGGTSIVTPVLDKYLTAGLDIFSDELAGTNLPAADEIAFSPNGDGAADYIYLRPDFLRNAASGSMTVLDENGNVVFTSLTAPNYFPKTHDYEAPVILLFEWNGSDGMNLRYTLPDGIYTLRCDFTLDYLSGYTQTYNFTVHLDTEKPSVDNYTYDADSGILTLTVSDNHKPRYVKLFENDSPESFGLIEYCTGVSEGGEFTAQFDLSGYDSDSIYVEIIDCAYNSLVDVIRLDTVK